jgi:hypothetical protein
LGDLKHLKSLVSMWVLRWCCTGEGAFVVPKPIEPLDILILFLKIV